MEETPYETPRLGEWRIRARCLLIAATLLTPAVCGAQAPKCDTKERGFGKPPQAKRVEQMGQVLVLGKDAAVPNASKVLIASFTFGPEDQVMPPAPDEVLIAFGTSRTPISDKCDFRFELNDSKGWLAVFGIPNPREIFVDELYSDDDAPSNLGPVPDATFVARFPFHPEAVEIRVLDAEGNEKAKVDVRGEIAKFCKKYAGHC